MQTFDTGTRVANLITGEDGKTVVINGRVAAGPTPKGADGLFAWVNSHGEADYVSMTFASDRYIAFWINQPCDCRAPKGLA